MAPNDTPAARAQILVDAADNGDYDAVRFIQAKATVHVLADYVPQRHKDLFGDDGVLRWAVGEVWTVCGTKLVRHRGGFDQGARLLAYFPDEYLCQRCHAAFSDRAVLLFEANQDTGKDPTQLGRLVTDTTTPGRSLQ